jgi:hypothetical protein
VNWLAGAVLTGVILAPIAVWVRRRFGADTLAVVAVAAGACILALGVTIVLRSPPRDGLGFGLFVLVPPVIGGTAALTVVVDRLARSSTIPDPLPEAAFGAAAFLGGVLGGLFVALFLFGLSVPRIA